MSDYSTVMYIDDDKVIHGELQSTLGPVQFLAVDRLFDRIGRGTIKSIAVNNIAATRKLALKHEYRHGEHKLISEFVKSFRKEVVDLIDDIKK